MDTTIVKPDPATEFKTPERCSILEIWNVNTDPAVSIARATVNPGVKTQLHRLKNVDERYVILSGKGLVDISSQGLREVLPGNVVVIPTGVSQQITNMGLLDLIFYCICTPRFTPECYESLE
jgi:mannose-6-phosphate isomerase-like protein (cupin superfamily)